MKTHLFESITEAQWKSGLSRHRCALCSYDYDDPVHCVSMWPLVLLINADYHPDIAPILIDEIGKLDENARVMLISCMVETARIVITTERN